MSRTVLASTLVLLMLLLASELNFLYAGTAKGAAPHFFPDPLTISMGNLDNSKLYAANSIIILQFSANKDKGSLVFYTLYPNNGY
jgi:hypothetical protein